ncbi:hypothetical protein LY76DRAFT_639049 [Colletotrichum caudatum]|nr:hypothetical protein LY76DRAFT_639049 [Colletotrichum caudatum]
MVKAREEVVSEFNEYVNMTADELESWLKSDDSNSAGWPKDDADEGGGETVGHDSGRKIVEILQANPDKKEDEYTDDQVEHMRKVVAYCKRHLAQESKSNSEKSPEEVKKTKSYASLKNWGHDILKAQGKEGGAEKPNGKSNGKSSKEEEEEEVEEENGEEQNGEEENGEEQDGDEEMEEDVEEVDDGVKEEADEKVEEKAGEKRKHAGDENGTSKKRQTRQGEGQATEKSDENGDEEEEEEEEQEDEQKEEQEAAADDGGEDEMDEGGDGQDATKGPEKGDTVSWNWGNGQPEGKVLDVKGEKTTIETKSGNEVSRDGKPDDPAVVLDAGKSKAIKLAHELNES